MKETILSDTAVAFETNDISFLFKMIIQTSYFVFYITRLEIEKQVAIQYKKIWDSIVRKMSIVTAQFPKKRLEYTIQELGAHRALSCTENSVHNALESRY